MIGGMLLNELKQGLVELVGVAYGKSKTGLDELRSFGEFTVVGSEDDGKAKCGGFDGIV